MTANAGNEFDFDAMMDLWAKGQQAFFKTQTDMVKGFAEAVTAESPDAAQEAAVAAWTKMMGGVGQANMGSANMGPANFGQAGFGNSVFANPFSPFDFSGIPGMGGMANPFAFMNAAGAAGADQAFTGMPNPMAMFSLMDPKTWAETAPDQIRTMLKNISASPRFADLATPHVETAEVWREFLDYQTAATDFAQVLQTAWTKALADFSASYSVEELQDGDVQRALDAWLKAANAALLETQHSEDFMDAQRRLLRAGLEIRNRQKDFAEQWSATYQMPTRTEIDDLTKIVHELRRDLRATKRELADMKAAQGAASTGSK
ncbi:MAG: poly(R)-hydroxyalkanoic acid synthase subunit PhaE [Pseudomonadota bacterium]